MKISLADLARLPHPARAVVHSLDRCLYQVTVELPAGSALLVADDGTPFRTRNLGAALAALEDIPLDALCLRQASAYDEMIGQPPAAADNALELPLRRTPRVV